MIHLALLAFLTQSADSASICIEDALTHAPLTGVHVTASATSNSRVSATSCLRVVAGRVVLRHVGYRPRTIQLSADSAVLYVALLPLSASRSGDATLLAVRRVVADASRPAAGRTVQRVDVASAREMGITSTAGLLGALPFASIRSARGETGVSLRGARREQVVITLDGMPLNDPSTGVADASDVPLVALGGASVVLGADPLNAGPGASGGVVSLESAAQRALTVTTGAFGVHGLEAAGAAATGLGLWRATGSYREAANDFPFENDAGATGVGARERRINNDETRSALSLGLTTARTQLAVLASSSTRGMVGPANVRTYDADRARTERVQLRAQASTAGVQLISGVRAFSLAYRDPTRPSLDASAHAVAGDAELSGMLRTVRWRAGGGADRVRATGGIEQARGRAFLVGSSSRRSARGAMDVGVRVDAIGTFGALPSFSLGAERTLLGSRDAHTESDLLWTLGARWSQALRVPTLYDLYFSSPQRLFVRTLRPERVLLDGELQSRLAGRIAGGAFTLQASLVARDTKDAIVWFPGNFGWSPANVGRERLRGAEARAAFRRSALRRAIVDVSAWVTRYDATLETESLRIPTPYVARTAGGAQFLLQDDGSALSVRMHATGRRPFSAGPRNAAFELPAVLLSDVALSRHVAVLATDALVSLSLDNATDVRWQSVRGFPSPGRSWAISTTIRHRTNP